MKSKTGVVGLGVMGGHLARNIERHGFPEPQRGLFGAHTCRRVDRNGVFNTERTKSS